MRFLLIIWQSEVKLEHREPGSREAPIGLSKIIIYDCTLESLRELIERYCNKDQIPMNFVILVQGVDSEVSEGNAILDRLNVDKSEESCTDMPAGYKPAKITIGKIKVSKPWDGGNSSQKLSKKVMILNLNGEKQGECHVAVLLNSKCTQTYIGDTRYTFSEDKSYVNNDYYPNYGAQTTQSQNVIAFRLDPQTTSIKIKEDVEDILEFKWDKDEINSIKRTRSQGSYGSFELQMKWRDIS